MKSTTAGTIGLRERAVSAERLFRVMGTDAHVIVVADDAEHLADVAIARLSDLEARWSRFRPESEISRLNRQPDRPVIVSPETFRLIDHALTGWRTTGGHFDPTLLPELRAAGYDRSFATLEHPGPLPVGAPIPECPPRVRLDALRREPAVYLDRVVGAVRLGPGTEFDPGGIGKGFAADLLVTEMLSSGARGVMINVGGDLRVAGETPEGSAWNVAVADPLDPQRVIGTLGLDAGAVATSWRTQRTWIGPDGRAHHHLIDPRSRRSAANGVAGVTVVAAYGWRAEVVAKAAFLAGAKDGTALIEEFGTAGLVFTDDGVVHPAGDIDAFLESEPAERR